MAKINTKTKISITDGVLIPGRDDASLFSAWRIAFYGAIAVLLLLLFVSPEPYRQLFKFVIGFDQNWNFDYKSSGLIMTFQVTVFSIIFALLVGLFIGLGRISRNVFINRISTVYVEVIRGIPLLVQLFYIYYALAKFVRISDITSAVIAIAICYGAYISEIFRAGIQSIPKGQMEAALALGFTRTQAIFRIILPQTLKVVLPPIGNEFIALLKDSSLVSILAVSDILRRGREFASISFDYFETYTMIAVIYLILTLFFSRLVAIMEERMKTDAKQS
ncbi:MAG: amino acid ABC transporter permease [Spirochaetae bacterium HGW-Spirochaetae-5]|nr:MAG: amino acid ABC transporter permease [Spirochaetae bacterium HGW-Spirochaetae-5]